VNALIHQRPAAVEHPRASPAGLAVVLGWPIPFHPRRRQQRTSDPPAVHGGVQSNDVRLRAVLEEHAKLDAGTVARLDQVIGAPGRDVDGLFGQDVEAACGGADSLFGVQARGAADRNEIHRLVRQKGVEVRVRPRVASGGESLDALRVGTMDRDDFDVLDSRGGACVRLADVASPENADPYRHDAILIRSVQCRGVAVPAVMQCSTYNRPATPVVPSKEDFVRITRIGPVSAGKVAFVLYAGIGLIIGCIVAVASLLGATIGAASGDRSALFGAIFGVGAVILLPIMYGVFGALGAMLAAALYNLTAGVVGGVELTIESAQGSR